MLVPGVRAGAVHVRGDVGGRWAAISPTEIADGPSHQRARTHTIGRVEPRPFTVAPLRGTSLTGAY